MADRASSSRPSTEEIAALLREVHGTAVRDLDPLRGGFWSSAYSYRVGDRELVLRLGDVREGFEMDRAAMKFDRPCLPVPRVLEIGDALGRSFAISVRHHGRFLETVGTHEAAAAGRAVEDLLSALRSVPSDPDLPVSWFPEEPAPSRETWRGWVADRLVDDPRSHVSGWRATLAADPELDALFVASEQRVRELLSACPERRDLVHGDLLHQNVLIDDGAERITAVFSWKCSVRGDFLYDVAWLTFWAPWHPGIAAIDIWSRALASPALSKSALDDAALRHHCYELQIGASHLGWCAWIDDAEELRQVAARTAEVLERGPLVLMRRSSA